ncbi:MAG: asparagine synthase (glutamine-hydrolyzing) [Bacteroidetes bacterium]|nr:asparagine synthase (glutamine-hydrolyzing) [Bacteroidota bacterium]
MCGFVGYVGLTNAEPISLGVFSSMNDVISHRGPDGEGFAFFGKYSDQDILNFKNQRPEALVFREPSKRTIALAHRRLSIIDLSTNALQPMQSIDKNITILFNGEIYNYQEIKAELLKKGHQFQTNHSDTEVIINAYIEWGIDCLKKFRGMFSIALWDEKKDTLWLIRDRIGIKPLYYTHQNGRVYFGSEIKAIIEDSSIKRAINHEGMYNYLSFLTVPAPQTLFENIYKLPAGHLIKIENGKFENPIEYWDVFDDVILNTSSEEIITKEVLEKLTESVNYHGVSDIPVGIFLSGGIDSSLNAALFSKIATYPVKAFSVGYENDENLKSYTNEFKYAQQAAKHANCEYYQQILTQQDFIDFLPKLIHHQDEPIGDPVCMPVYYVSKLAKENNISVCQVGEGSDELFWGYSSWKYMLRLQNLNDITIVPKGFKKLILNLLKSLGKNDTVYYEWLKRGIEGKKIFWSGAEAFTETQKNKLLSKKFIDKIQPNYSSWEIVDKHYQNFKQKATEKSNLNWMSYIDLKMRLPELLLMRVDKMSMAVSLEARVPFLDDRFVSYAMGIPTKLKTTKGESKYILKQAIKNIIPDSIIHRKKQGFDAPVYDWMMDDLGNIAREKIALFNEHTGYLNESYINTIFEKKNGKQLWFVLNLALWWEYYIFNR